MPEQKHIIHRVNVEIDVPDISTGRRMYNNITDSLRSIILPAIEAELDMVLPENKHYRTDSFTIEVSLSQEDEFETSIGKIVSRQVDVQLAELLSTKQLADKVTDKGDLVTGVDGIDQTFEQKSVTEKSWEIFIHFLKTGKLPWYAGAEKWLDQERLIDEIQPGNKQHIETFKNVLAQHPTARQRLVKQFTREFILRLIEKQYSIRILHYFQKVKNILLNKDFKRSDEIEKEFMLKVLTTISSDDRPEPGIEAQLEEYVDTLTIPVLVDDKENSTDSYKSPQKKPEEKPEAKKKRFIPFEEDGLYVQNAGLILLHPFLQYFFMEFGLLKENKFKDEAAQQNAIHLLHYLATGKEQPYEYDLLFEKYLCGCAFEEPIDRFVTLSDKMKEESANLLKAAIHHWKVLKNTSAQGLQEGFLQRNGKLVQSPQQHRLIVENNTIDILLDQVPWGYSIIQLPWMQEILYVDWITR